MSERDQFLTEAMGGCWHKWIDRGHEKPWLCLKCKLEWHNQKQDYNFSTWQGFGKLWEWVQKKNTDCEEYEEWAQHFLFSLQVHCLSIGYYVHVIPESVIGPDAFADALYEFLKEELCR